MSTPTEDTGESLLNKTVYLFLKNKFIVLLLLIFITVWGLAVAPFDWSFTWLPRSPVPVDAIPDIGENQQIVFTKWMGRSPRDVDDQITYPLTSALMGIPRVKTVRSFSMLGFSSIYIIFDEKMPFYESRTRVLEKLASLPPGTLPEGVTPVLGPDATALGQIFWYTLEGRDTDGNPAGGWDLQELRSIQDWNVRYSLLSAGGIAEVASVGGFVKEYQVDADPDAMRAHRITLAQLIAAVRMSNIDIGAKTLEINSVEYLIRGIGFIKNLEDIEQAVVTTRDNVPIYVKDVAHVSLGPALRRGALDKEGSEAVGGVAVVRYGDNPLEAINNIKTKIAEIQKGLPEKTLSDGRVSKVTIVPFYDRTGLIYETLRTLETALTEEILVTVIVILAMLIHLQSSVVISGMLPLTVFLCFIAMKTFGVDANIVSLSGIAIAIGTIVDMGIVVSENIIRHLEQDRERSSPFQVTYNAVREVSGAVLTAVATTVVSFLPVFTMTAAEGKLFKPLAFTKTFALLGSIITALFILPAFAQILFSAKVRSAVLKKIMYGLLTAAGIVFMFTVTWWAGLIIAALGGFKLVSEFRPALFPEKGAYITTGFIVLLAVASLAVYWSPLGPQRGMFLNLLFVSLLIGTLLGSFYLFHKFYVPLLSLFLKYKSAFLSAILLIVLAGGAVWMGMGREFMPPLDEGSYLLMPTTMPHASIGEAMDVLRKQDMAITQIPEVDSAVGKIGRADTPLDPAPVSMIETVINYKTEYITDGKQRLLTYRYSSEGQETLKDAFGNELRAPDGKSYFVRGVFARDADGRLIPEKSGMPFRQWRAALDPAVAGNEEREPWEGVSSPDDIWDLILSAAEIPGTTSAPKLQPIGARLVMLQSGMRAPMGIKIKGSDLKTIESVGLQIETLLKSGQVKSVKTAAVNADRIVGKPYIEIHTDRNKAARYGVQIHMVQDIIESAVGGMPVTQTVEARERYSVRVRYKRELRDSIEELGNILIPAPGGVQIPLKQIADITYVRGPQMIKSEDTFKTGYVLFDKNKGYAEVDTVEDVSRFLDKAEENGTFNRLGTEITFAGNYENQIRAQRRLSVVLPLALLIIFVILYIQFHSVSTTFLVFSGILVAWSGGFIMLWLYGQDWFLNVTLFGVNLQELFQVRPFNLSVAVWVGFLALFGIATDDGVVMGTYLEQVFKKDKPGTRDEIRKAVIKAGSRRVRPCLMTTATTILALIPILTSTGRGSDIMVPMAIPSFGGMFFEVITMFVVPVLYSLIKEIRTVKSQNPS